MKAAAFALFLVASPAWAVGVGETYQQLVAELGNPRSSIVAGSTRILNYPGVMIKVKDDVVISVTAVASTAAPAHPATPGPASTAAQVLPPNGSPAEVAQIYALANQINDAVKRILTIVNQPVAHVPRTPGMTVQSFGPHWFHPGTIRPDFNTPDIAKTQELLYSKYGLVSSDLNPNEAFVGSELEYNSMTKFFYVDPTVPKKRLTPREMGEIDQLYRVIGQCEPMLVKLGYTGKMP